MKSNLYRQLRFVIAVVVGIGIFAIAGALLIAFWNEHLQREFLDALVADEYQELLEHLKDHPEAPLPRSVQLRIWMDGHPESDPMPEALRNITMGTHHDLPIGDRFYHVLRTQTGDYPTFVAIETSSFSYQERWLRAALLGLAFLDVPFAFFMGIWLVRQIAIPHEMLAKRVSELDPAEVTTHIGSDFQGLEVEKIAKSIDQYQDRLRGFIDRERTFTTAASHELRTPLTSIRTSAELLEMHPSLNPELKGYTGKLIRASLEMGEILEGLMWISREKENPRTETIRLEDHMREMAATFPDRSIRIITPQPPESEQKITLPAVLLHIVVNNLLRNACQFSPKDSTIEIEVGPTGLTIRNQGQEIPAASQARIYERFYRSPESSGQGLGLYIASEICQRLNWRLQVLSQDGVTSASLSFS